MKRVVLEWTLAFCIGGVYTAAAYFAGWWIGGTNVPDWFVVLLAGTIGFRNGRKWERN